jgi:peroxiredoxin
VPIKPVFLFLLLSQVALAQAPQDLFRAAEAKCRSIQFGSFQSKTLQKPNSSDSLRSGAHTTFKKVPSDTVYGWVFRARHSFNGRPGADCLYNGECFFDLRNGDSSGLEIPTDKYGTYIKNYLLNSQLYAPFEPEHNDLFPAKDDYNNADNIFRLIGRETVSGFACFHISETRNSQVKHGRVTTLKTVVDLWINIEDSIPIQYTRYEQYRRNADTMAYFERSGLESYSLNVSIDTSLLSRRSIPAFCRLREYSPQPQKPLLAVGTEAPDWNLPTAGQDSIRLTKLRGRVVLIDFFYMACSACMDAMPTLHQLHEKYSHQGLTIIGFDSFDKRDKRLLNFIQTRQIPYSVVLNGSQYDDQYHVSGYPTFYLIDKNGKIAYAQAGYSERDAADLQKAVEKLL